MKTIEGKLQAQGLKFVIVATRFNDIIVDRLIGGATDYLVRHGGAEKDITLVRVPGAFEMPALPRTALVPTATLRTATTLRRTLAAWALDLRLRLALATTHVAAGTLGLVLCHRCFLVVSQFLKQLQGSIPSEM